MGSSYEALGSGDRALGFYQRALLIMVAIGNREGEGATLNNIALLSSRSGDHAGLRRNRRSRR
jgi:hypothetical protein